MPVYCPKCGSHSGFVVMPNGHEDIPVRELKPEHLVGKGLVVCSHCHYKWSYPKEAPTPPKPQPEKRRRKKI